MNTYELILIVDPALSAEEQKKLIGKMEKTIAEDKGKVTQSEEMGKKRFAYPINKQLEGYYWFFQFELNPQSIKKVDTLLKLEDKVIRHLLLKD